MTSYSYDNVSRLIQIVQNPSGTSYDLTLDFSYDPAGAIASTSRSNDSYAWTGHYAVNRNYTANGLNQYSASGSVSPTYDARGNLQSAGGSNWYSYNSDNLLYSAWSQATLSYDPIGRMHQEAGASTTRMLWDGDTLIAEYDNANALQRRYVFGPDTDEPLVRYEGTGASDRHWYHADERGSIVAISDGSGAVTNVNRYDEYGIPGSGNAGRFQYTGQQWLADIGIYYYRARMYSPTFGRFLQTDPIGYGGGMNLYSYAGNDPANGSDPTGLVNTNCTGSLICPVWQNGGFNGTYSVGLCGSCSGTSTASITGSVISSGTVRGTIDTYKVANFDSATKTLVGSPWIEVRGTAGLAGFFLTTAEGGSSRCRWNPLVCELWANREIQGRMINSWTQANTGPEASENEHSFWITRRGNDFVAGAEIIGRGPLTFGIMAQRPSGATILFHTHNISYLSPGLSGLDAMLLRRNPFILVILSREGWTVWESPLMPRGR